MGPVRHSLFAVMAIAAGIALGPGPAFQAQTPDPELSVLLQEAAAYAVQFKREFGSVVMEESYAQEARSPGNITTSSVVHAPYRTLRSDLLLIRLPGFDRHLEFRDVFEVDGKAVRDRQERLTRLFLQPDTASAAQQAQRIAAESARYNIGSVYRNVNTPTLPLLFLEPNQQARFTFRRTKDVEPSLAPRSGTNAFTVPPDAVTVEFREVQKGTLIRRMTGAGDLPARGRFWLQSGRVLMSELVLEDPAVHCMIAVAYRRDDARPVLVPAEMRERYVNNQDRSLVTGTARYGNLRAFSVEVGQTIDAPRQR